MWDKRHGKAIGGYLCHGKAYALYRDTAFLYYIAHNLRRGLDMQPQGVVVFLHASDYTCAVNMSGNDMTAEACLQCQRTLKVHHAARLEGRERRAAHGLRHNIERSGIALQPCHGKADPVGGYAVANQRTVQDLGRLYLKRHRLRAATNGLYLSYFLYYASEHCILFFTTDYTNFTDYHLQTN